MTDWLGAGDCGDVAASLTRYANGGVVGSNGSDKILVDHVSDCSYLIPLNRDLDRARNIMRQINQNFYERET